MASISTLLPHLAITTISILYTLFLLLFPPSPYHSSFHSSPHRLLLETTKTNQSCSAIKTLALVDRCAFSLSNCHGEPGAFLNYAAIHYCLSDSNPSLSLPLLALLLLLQFRFLAAAAGAHFSPAVSRLAASLRLSPSMAAVTLLALGNGAPDAFSSAAALRGGDGMPRVGLAAILSGGAFVSAFVFGAVALRAAPFAVRPEPFVRDVFFYLVAASGLFYVYLSAEIFLWQAVGLVLFYVFFVGFVFYMDLGVLKGDEGVREVEMEGGVDSAMNRKANELPVKVEEKRQDWRFCSLLQRVCIRLKINKFALFLFL